MVGAGQVTEEEHTCCAIIKGYETWGFDTYDYVAGTLEEIWREQYGITSYPAGYSDGPQRESRRFDFCWWMAERIREELGEEA